MHAFLHYEASATVRERIAHRVPPWLQIGTGAGAQPGWREALASADVLLHVLAPVTVALLETAPRLRLVQKIGVGLNTIDLQACQARGIRVANMPGTNSQAVCEATLALMFAVLRRTLVLDRATRSGAGWALPAGLTDDIGELAGRTVGLIGFGEVPRRLAPVLRALGAHVIVHTRTEGGGSPAHRVGLREVIAQSDVLSLHVPLTDETRGMIDAATIASMKKGAILINTARGGLVDEQALRAALASGHLAGAGLDVFEAEPAAAGHPLFALDNVVVSPHLAWLTTQTLARSLDVAIENCARLRENRPLLHEITLNP